MLINNKEGVNIYKESEDTNGRVFLEIKDCSFNLIWNDNAGEYL